MRDQVCFGYLGVSLQGEVGVVTVDPNFSPSTEDEHDWNNMVDWCWAQGFELANDEPATMAGDGTEIYLLRRLAPAPPIPTPSPPTRSGVYLPAGGRRRHRVR